MESTRSNQETGAKFLGNAKKRVIFLKADKDLKKIKSEFETQN